MSRKKGDPGLIIITVDLSIINDKFEKEFIIIIVIIYCFKLFPNAISSYL